MIFSFFFLLFIILIIIGILTFRKRYCLLFLLLLFFPTVLVLDQSTGERLSSGIQEMGVSISLFTCFDIIVEFTGYHRGMIVNGSKLYYDMLFVVEIYSVLLMVFLYVSLRWYNRKGIYGNFNLYAQKFYTTFYFWGPMLACSIAIFVLTDNNAKPITSFHFSNQYLIYKVVYLIVYFIVLMVVMRHYFFLTSEEKFHALFLVLFFPVMGFSGEYKAVSSGRWEEYFLENHVALYPLAYALPKTIISFFAQWHIENFSFAKLPAIYVCSRVSWCCTCSQACLM